MNRLVSHLTSTCMNQAETATMARMKIKMMKSITFKAYILGMTSATRSAKD